MRGPPRSRTLNPGGLQAFISSGLPALKVERGWHVKASRRPAVGGHARPAEEPTAERWRAPGLHLFKASGLQGRAWIVFERIKNNSYSTKPSNYASKFGRPDSLDSRGIDEKTIIQSKYASKCGGPDGHARPSEEPNAERWRAAGLQLFKASGLQG